MSSNTDHTPSDVEGATAGVPMESAQRLLSEKKTIWQSIRANPKVIFIAFFASLGGFEYGYQQGVLGQSLVMTRFINNFPSVVQSSSATGWLTSILQLGGLFGSLSAGVLSEIISRKYTMFVACCWVVLGSYLYVGASEGMSSLLYAGRFFTGLGVGLFSGVGPLYNAELSSPEMRGLLVSFYQFATILGIMLSFWVGYGSNYIGGTGDGQSDLAWRLPSIIQGIPAVALAVGIWFMPFSPRWLVKVGRDEEARATLAWMRKLPQDDDRIQVEYLEIKAEAEFEKKAFAREFPRMAEEGSKSALREQIAQFVNCFRTKDNVKRIAVAWLVMFWQQWSGIDAIIYYATNIFQSLGLTGGTIALLATGVTGVVFLCSTIPAMLIIDRVGRKPMLLVGSVVMGISMVIVGIIVAKFRHDWPSHVAAGWVAVALIWVYIAGFGATWGPVSWTLISEIFPLSIRAKGAAIGASSNWLNNFAIAFFVPPMLEAWAWGTYIFFAVFLTAGIFWVWFFLPETKNATLEEMDRVFGSHTGERDAQLLYESQQEVGLIALLERREVGHEKAGVEKHIENIRRRKCDEKKPQCTSCETRGFTCKYPDLTFVQASRSAPPPETGPRRASTSYSTITFVNQGPPTPASKASDKDDTPQEASLAASHARATREESSVSQSPRASAKPAPPTAAAKRSPRKDCPLSTCDSYFTTKDVSPRRKEAAVLRHFRYKMVPWIEAGDPAAQFGVDIMQLSQERPPIHTAIVAISSLQLDLIAGLAGHDTVSLAYRQRPSDDLFEQDRRAKRVGEALLALEGFLSSSPSRWRNLPLLYMKEVSSNVSVSTVEEPLQTLCRLHARIDLASSILTGQPPITSITFHTPGNRTSSTADTSPTGIYNWSLQHLTSCLHLIHNSTQLPSIPSPQSPPAGSLSAHAGFSARWFSLWTSCQTWFANRPLTMRPILDIRSVEAGQIEPNDGSSFPIQVYTNALAIHANVAYHITSLLLLAHKPRLLKLPGEPQRQRPAAASSSSQGWHAQTIAGIAARNEFAEQWDPVTVGALLYVAREMTHPAQQEALESCFARVTAATGIGLEKELHELREGWKVARSYERDG
ncbi:MFS quinate transporter [Purpureocillium lilacinum]|uniref:MFS quinate transporter n=1 Tax=Purpureocillium lilacinum TaxID=33203 RepID=A0A179GDF0_PURLI|nr:MFS quinate transporter [Purpureocillium lilacinum]OAQ75846.1 MFS quinate transporter [Purpureocillium lilacinum]